MKFMAIYSYPAANFLSVVKAWATRKPQEPVDHSAGVKLISRWHDMAGRRAFHVFEADNIAIVARFLAPWNSLGEFAITPVLDDEEETALSRQVVADLKA